MCGRIDYDNISHSNDGCLIEYIGALRKVHIKLYIGHDYK